MKAEEFKLNSQSSLVTNKFSVGRRLNIDCTIPHLVNVRN